MTLLGTSSRVLLGVDLGTTAVKAGLFDLDGQLLGQASRLYPTCRPRPGWVEQDPDEWWRALEDVVSEVLAKAGVDRVDAMGICSQANTHVFADADGRSLLPAIVWQDQRASSFAMDIDSRIDDENRTRIWRAPVHVDGSSALARLSWCAHEHRHVFENTRWLLSPKDYCNAQLTGDIACDPITSIGLVSAAGSYLSDALALVPGASERLPPLRGMTEVLDETYRPLGDLRPGVPLVEGSMDAWASRYGSGVTSIGQGMEVAGTSEILGMLSDVSGDPVGVVAFPPLDGRWFYAGPTQAGGDALRWWASQRGTDVDHLVSEAARCPLGSGGLVFLPHLMGERAPMWDADARGSFVGLSTDHGRAHLARAVMEGVAYSARHLLEALEAAAAMRCGVLRASGGGAVSDEWCQMKSDVFGLPLERVAVRSSGILGAAVLAGVGVGLLDDVDADAARMAVVERRFDPDPDAHSRYLELYDCYRSLQSALQPSWRVLARFRDEAEMPLNRAVDHVTEPALGASAHSSE